MKLHLNKRPGPDTLLIHSWAFGPAEGAGTDAAAPKGDECYRIRIADTWYQQSLILTPRSVKLWDVRDVSALAPAHFQQLAELGAEVVILGVGKRAVFPEAALTRSLVNRQIGLEVMDTAAAGRPSPARML